MKILIVTNMYPTVEKPAFGTFVKDQVEDLKRAGVEVDVFFIDGRRNLRNYILAIFGFWRQLLRQHYDVIHAHYTHAGLIARLQLFYPVILTHHGSDLLHSTRIVMVLSRVLHPFFTRVIVVSRQMQEIFNDNRTVLIPCAINLEEMKPISRMAARQRLDLQPDKPLVLFAGQHHQAVKRFKLLKQAMEVIQKSCPEVELVVVSGQPHTVIPIYMSACDVLVLTSLSEGSPMVIKEAMACNLPIVSVNVGDVAEVIEGVEGCYIAEPTAPDIADKILLTLAHRKRTQGREKIEYLGSGPITQRIISLYNEVCRPERRVKFEALPNSD